RALRASDVVAERGATGDPIFPVHARLAGDARARLRGFAQARRLPRDDRGSQVRSERGGSRAAGAAGRGVPPAMRGGRPARRRSGHALRLVGLTGSGVKRVLQADAAADAEEAAEVGGAAGIDVSLTAGFDPHFEAVIDLVLKLDCKRQVVAELLIRDILSE